MLLQGPGGVGSLEEGSVEVVWSVSRLGVEVGSSEVVLVWEVSSGVFAEP